MRGSLFAVVLLTVAGAVPAAARAEGAATRPASPAELMREEARRLLAAGDYEGARTHFEAASVLERAEEDRLHKTADDAARAARIAEAEAERSRLAAARAARPFWKKAWFWSIVGGAVAVGVGATVAAVLLAPREPPPNLGLADCTGSAPACTYRR